MQYQTKGTMEQKKLVYIIQQVIPNSAGVTGDGRVCVFYNANHGLVSNADYATRFLKIGDAMRKCIDLMKDFKGTHFKVVEAYE